MSGPCFKVNVCWIVLKWSFQGWKQYFTHTDSKYVRITNKNIFSIFFQWLKKIIIAILIHSGWRIHSGGYAYSLLKRPAINDTYTIYTFTGINIFDQNVLSLSSRAHIRRWTHNMKFWNLNFIEIVRNNFRFEITRKITSYGMHGMW